MPKAYKVVKRTILFDKENPRNVYTVAPVNYGTLTTDDVARQISAESAVTPGDVKNVLDRYAYYVVENLKKGYAIQLLGFGVLNLRFIKTKTVSTEKEANASLIKAIVPGFTPSFTVVNGSRIYDLVPEKIQLVKYSGSLPAEGETPSGGSGEDAGGATIPDPLG